jgi:hypothetical protein
VQQQCLGLLFFVTRLKHWVDLARLCQRLRERREDLFFNAEPIPVYVCVFCAERQNGRWDTQLLAVYALSVRDCWHDELQGTGGGWQHKSVMRDPADGGVCN